MKGAERSNTVWLVGALALLFVLSLGWFDPNLELAAKVKSCNLVISGFSGRLQVRDSGVKKIREIFF